MALLQRGANPNARTDKGWTPLIKAVWRDSAPVVRLLLEGGADPRHRDRRGKTALDYARAQNAQRSIALLEQALRQPQRPR